MKIKTKRRDKAVSEIVGTILLLAIAICVFSVVYMNVLSEDGPSPETYATIIGKMETGNAIFEHRRGEGISTDSKVIIIPRGSEEDKIVGTVAELLDPTTSNGDNIWDIGERLRCPEDFTGCKVEAIVIDSETNSIIMWGTLQEGYIEPPFGMGGVWHFNELEWNGILNEVIDTSGNNNHGTAYNGATTTNVSAKANRSGIFNVIDDDDYVEVQDAYSLDITDQITMEAWIKPFNIDVSGTTRLENKFGFTPYITHVSKNLFAIVSEDKVPGEPHSGFIQTVNITARGHLEPTGYKIENFGSSQNQRDLRPIITYVSGDVYVVAYNNKSKTGGKLNVHLKTFNIYSDGSIKYTENELVFDDYESKGGSNRPSIIKVTDDVFAIAYWVDYSDHAVGILKTVNISSDGTIEYTGNMLTFDDIQGYEPSIIHVAGEVFAIAYRGTSNQGIIKTFNIYSNGTIKNIGITKTFESSSCFDPYMIHHSENYYVIVYSVYSTEVTGLGYPIGNYKTIEIVDNGTIANIESTEPFDQNRCYNPIVIKISKRVFAIVYEGFGDHPGNLITILVDYPSDVYSRGIYKLGSYGIYANANKVYVNINTKTINASIIHDSWNYVVLTYNKDAPSDQMKLYVNGTLKASRTLTEKIKTTDSNLLFGDLFYGLIDEIAIHDKALTLEEIQIHYNNPGYFENEI